MPFSFDPDRIEIPIGHHICGAFVAVQGEVPIHRPSDNVAFADCPVADADVVDDAEVLGQLESVPSTYPVAQSRINHYIW